MSRAHTDSHGDNTALSYIVVSPLKMDVVYIVQELYLFMHCIV